MGKLFGFLKMFVLVNVGERIGSGLQNIRYVWDTLKLPIPYLRETFSPDRVRLEVVLWNAGLKLENRGGMVVGEPLIADKVPDNLSVNQQRIIKLLLNDNQLSMTDLSEKVGISKRKILDNINKLKVLGLLQRVGDNKSGYWKVVLAL